MKVCYYNEVYLFKVARRADIYTHVADNDAKTKCW